MASLPIASQPAAHAEMRKKAPGAVRDRCQRIPQPSENPTGKQSRRHHVRAGDPIVEREILSACVRNWQHARHVGPAKRTQARRAARSPATKYFAVERAKGTRPRI
jgi:hypothetical protein